MHTITHEYFTGKKPFFAVPYFILKDKRVSCSSLCLGSYNCHVHTIGPTTPISNYYSADVSILNTYFWIFSNWRVHTKDHPLDLQNYIWILNKIFLCVSMAAYKLATILHIHWYLWTLNVPDLCTVPLYTCSEYNNMACNTLLTQSCDRLVTQVNLLIT